MKEIIYRDGQYYQDEFSFFAATKCPHSEEEMEGLECRHPEGANMCDEDECPLSEWQRLRISTEDICKQERRDNDLLGGNYEIDCHSECRLAGICEVWKLRKENAHA